mgnify:CR=1 FL=1
MGDGSNSINFHRVGVIRENPMRCIYTADDQGEIFIVSSSEFENRTDLKDGDCCVVDFKTNFSEELGNGVTTLRFISMIRSLYGLCMRH